MNSRNHEAIDGNMPLSSTMQLMSVSQKPLELKVVTLLFKQFTAIYLQKWTDQITDAQQLENSMREWAIGIEGLTPQQIKLGIDLCRTNLIWPPAIAEFLVYAKGSDANSPMKAANRLWVVSTEYKSDPATTKAAIATIRLNLR